ncbi:MAG: AMP-binding protein, partial [bacterium]|nr:AMP-binding protein [bacterium]
AAVLASLRAGASVVCTEGFHAVKFFRWLDEFEPTWYTAVPTMHQALLARAEQEPEPPKRTLRFARSSSASLPPKVMADIEKLFQAPVIEAYGMTEAAHQMASNPLPPAARKPGSVGPPGGPEVAILDESGSVLASGAKGELAIRGANVTPGYAANEDANRAAFNNGWFRTGDQGYLDEDGYLFLTGRLKEIINRGGEKISPREVDDVLLEHPAIQQAVTFAVAHEQLGEEIGAAVIVRAGKDLTERDVREYAATRLADFKVPRVVKLVDSIPKGPTGKLQRIGLADKLGIKPMSLPAKSSRSVAVAPSSDIERRLTELWAEVLAHDQFGASDEFFAVGGNSLQATQLLAKLQEVGLGLLPVLDFMDAPTVSGMAEHLAKAAQPPPFTDGLVLLQPKGTAPPLFCAGPHNGSLLGLAGIARHLGADQPLIGIDPRLADGDTSLTVEAVAERAIERLRAYQPSGPYYFLGMCFGAKILFEAACQLQQQGEKVGFLGLINAFHVRQTSGSERVLKGVQNLVRRGVFHSRRLGGLPPAEMFGY